MKKYLYSIFAAILAVGCTTFSVEQPLPVESAGVPTIAVGNVEDISITATITAPEGTSFYSYAVMAGAEAQLDSATLFQLGYKSKSVAYGTVNFKKNKGIEVTAGSVEKPLTRNADYTIYAVVANEQGTIGKVVAKTVHTSDGQAPKPTSLSSEGNTVTLKFSEAVSYNSSKPATAKYYAPKLAELNEEKDAIAEDGCMGDAKVAAEMAADGASVKFTVTMADGSDLPAGAIYAVSYPAGAFQDKAGNAMAALTSGPVAKDEKIAWSNACAQIANKAWNLIDDDAENNLTAPSKKYYTYTIPEGVELYDYTEGANINMTVVVESATRKSEKSYDLKLLYDWGMMNETQLIVFYPDDIDIQGGSDLTITIAANSMVDIYGNPNAELKHAYLYSFGFTMDDFVGTYSYTGEDSDGWGHTEAAVVVTEDPDTENGLLFTDLFKSMTNFGANYYTTWEPAGAVVKGVLNCDTGEISIEDNYVVINAASPAFTNAYGYTGTLSAAFAMQATTAGNIETAWRYYMDGTNYYWSDEEGVLVRTGAAPAAAPKAGLKAKVMDNVTRLPR